MVANISWDFYREAKTGLKSQKLQKVVQLRKRVWPNQDMTQWTEIMDETLSKDRNTRHWRAEVSHMCSLCICDVAERKWLDEFACLVAAATGGKARMLCAWRWLTGRAPGRPRYSLLTLHGWKLQILHGCFLFFGFFLAQKCPSMGPKSEVSSVFWSFWGSSESFNPPESSQASDEQDCDVISQF